ncbi:hypothetical protein NLI96_g9915 [Meripilus lineatus]|uniref:DUF6534 domain-containing protein n=1 Tax=Meripilus lineatus TaxID=2056292 RepID=A0AAD5UUW2_9APHY|nr:hypothetical protein NLI96_g9915 [Physisporinus lineatus]
MATLPFNKDTTLGATFIGFAASAVLFGVACAQTWTYLGRYPQDKTFYKLLVSALWILECVHQVFIGHSTYYYTITNWGNARALLQAPQWSLIVQVTLGAVVGGIVKICFAMRVWRFSQRNIPVTCCILLLIIAQLGKYTGSLGFNNQFTRSSSRPRQIPVVSCFYTVQGFGVASLTQVDELKLIGTLSLGLGVATDVLTAGALCFFLRGLRTGYSKDDSLINRLTLYAINTGILTSAVSLATLVLYDTMPTNFIFMGFYFVLSKLYLNSFLATHDAHEDIEMQNPSGVRSMRSMVSFE